MAHSKNSPLDALAHAGRGLLMGAADIVPGVSGGTVALVLGVYERLVTAISRIDAKLLALVWRGKFSAAAKQIDLGFLLPLSLGIGAGVVGLAGVMHTLLEQHREATFAAFFGLILASGVLVGRMCRPKGTPQTIGCLLLAVAGAWGAYWLVSQAGIQNRPGHGYTFFCGCVGICAMILPGVSGSYLLLLLDKYEQITGIIKRLPRMEVTTGELTTLVVFAGGCVVGLIAFSRVLRWLLKTLHAETMALLCGFMIGSLYKVWPFQAGPVEQGASMKEQALHQSPMMPTALSSHVAFCAAIAVGCFFGVLVVDALARRARLAVRSGQET